MLTGGHDERLFKQLADISTRDVPFEEKATELLALGAEVLDIDRGEVAWAHPQLDRRETVVGVGTIDDMDSVGSIQPLSATYCRVCVNQRSTHTITDAATGAWDTAEVSRSLGLRTYLGTSFDVPGDGVGVVCFTQESPRGTEFTTGERAFAEHLATLISASFTQSQQSQRINRYEHLIHIFARVLRHNLRNNLSVIHAQVDQLEGLMDQSVEGAGHVINALAELDELGEKSAKLREVAQVDLSLDLIPVPRLARGIARAAEKTYPEASTTVQTSTDARLLAFPSLEIALQELVENAIEYSEDPECSIRINSTPETVVIDVVDNGPGLPEHEQRVLNGEVATPLTHGSGVGLWIVWWIVDVHGGTIQSAVTDEGTTVSVAIPRQAVATRALE